MVEVVHVRRPGATPAGTARPAAWSVRAETWPEGFRAKIPAPTLPTSGKAVTPEPAAPTVHVMPMWEPTPRPPSPEADPPDVPRATATGTRRRRAAPPRAEPALRHERTFADLFGEEEGANCVRCGYLIAAGA
ncbi:hypothetical protein [Paracraurococcus lichenis]|uniref:Uncharacterized protein n=1 Tax=Paracraurococcus lichenis TaxID=3064888 RepID=A0ABT9EBE7_9PROT|nr:hypothetical protein [Paracraurococcus sp. LOR1-02]MDO9713526.1 hypothetical protein [Paracraurococcus sp. LOR1-02]